MRPFILAILCLAVPAFAAAAPVPPPSGGPVPLGRLSDVARPLAYRLDLTILPDQPRFVGHAEIEVDVKAKLLSLYLHGRDLNVMRAGVRAAGGETTAVYTQVDPLGVARLDFARPLEPGRATLVFDYDAPFGESAAGLFHVKVGEDWYAWTQFESIDARAAYPGFDQPGFKTPFTVSVTTRKNALAYANGAEIGSEARGELVRHNFATTRPLPTYLVAFGAGPFASAAGVAAPTTERSSPLPVRIIGTRANAAKTAFALENTGPIVDLLEGYFGRPFPFPKLDQIGSPIMGGAMENAGADTYGDSLLFLDQGASTAQKRNFGMVVAHELSHQWFGDLVTPEWWDDIWLNESFANWMGYRIGEAWRPDLKIGVGAVEEAFAAMNVDALKAGRPIHQAINTSGEIDAAFDAVTYGKGGQVVAMIAAYLGDEKFRAGVRLHLSRHAYANATTDQFFAALAEAAQDPGVLEALRSFVNQPGLPVVRVEHSGGDLLVSQRRYGLLGAETVPQTWSIPLCVRVGEKRNCQILGAAPARIPSMGKGILMPNAGGVGYYRFSLSDADWRLLLGEAGRLPAGEALAAADSLWGAFRAGEAAPDLLLNAAGAFASNPYSGAAVTGGTRLAFLRRAGLIPPAQLPAYREFIRQTFSARLAALGFDPRAGAYAAEDPDRQALRADLVALLATEAEDADVRAALVRAAAAFLAGDGGALDQSLYGPAFLSYAVAGGETALTTLLDKGLASQDTVVHDAAVAAVAQGGTASVGAFVLAKIDDPRLRPGDRLSLLRGLMSAPATRDAGGAWILGHFDALTKDAGIFVAATLPGYFSGFCSVDKAAEIEATLRPKVVQYQRGALSLDRTVEQVRSCGVLKTARGGEVAALFTGL
jgi:aminopeptidase N